MGAEDAPPALDAAQARVLERVAQGRSVFFTGSAGTGKTFLLSRVIDALEARHGGRAAVAVTATTGIAAANVRQDGMTLNGALGLGVPQRYADFWRGVQRSRARLAGLRALVVDEVSMLSAEAFEMLDDALRRLRPRHASEPMGGVQLVACGDFYQLPPVCAPARAGGDANQPADAFLNFGYAFECDAWGRVFAPDDQIVLTRPFRQTEPEFAALLDRVRRGERDALAEVVRRCSAAAEEDATEDVRPTMLYARNVDVDRLNALELRRLPGDERVLAAQDAVAAAPGAGEGAASLASAAGRGYLERECPAPSELRLKAGAQVMLLRNLGDGARLFNGSRGVVVGFRQAAADGSRPTATDVPVVRFACGTETALPPMRFERELRGLGTVARMQVPLKLAWNLSIHKSQGLTLDAVQVSLTGMFAPGQAYVALSRARTLRGLRVLDWDGRAVAPDPRVVAFYAALERGEPYVSDRWAAHWSARKTGLVAAT